MADKENNFLYRAKSRYRSLLGGLLERLDQPIEADRQDASADHPETVPAPQPPSTLMAAGQRILLLSESDLDHDKLIRHLQSWGLQPVTCQHATRAFTTLLTAVDAGDPFHSVLMDGRTRDMDALQFANCIQSDPDLQQLQLILIDAGYPEAWHAQLSAAGFSALLTKPLDKRLLFNALHSETHATPHPGKVTRLIDHYSLRPLPRPLSILLADSNQNGLRQTRQILEQAGHQVFVAETGARVLDALDSHRFDVTIVSARLPEIDGLETFKLYRFSHTGHNWIPFVILLEDGSAGEMRQCLEAGVEKVLINPQTPVHLVDAIEQVAFAAARSARNESRETLPLTAQPINIDGLTLDRQRLKELQQLGEGKAFLHQLLDNFHTTFENATRQMRYAVEHEDLRQFQELGLELKDSAGCLGMKHLYQLAARAGRVHTDDFSTAAPQLIEELSSCAKASHKALAHYLADDEIIIHGEF